MRFFRTGRFRLLSGLLALSLSLAPAFAEVNYTVRSGDSLSKIAKNFSVSLDTLLKFNQITTPNRLTVGQVIRIPEKDDPATAEDMAQAPDPSSTGEYTDTARPEPAAVNSQPHQLSGRELLDARAKLLQDRDHLQQSGVAEIAQAFAGTPYRWGGLSSRGIDCSGLVVRAMLAQGRYVPHHAATLFKMGTPVSYKDLQPGDLVFFATMGNTVSHVGIWVGNNRFVHASCSRGVVIDKLAGYYARRLVGARRL